MLKVAPSILSSDFARLGEEVRMVDEAGADWIHIDVMDGRFVPNLTLGPPIVKAIRPHTEKPLDCHLMIVEPERYVGHFVDAGADSITVHAEACMHLHRTVQEIHGAGARAGVALNPATPVSAVEHVLDGLDMVLVMTVNPGFGGQSFIEAAVPKVRRVRDLAQAAGREEPLEIQVDGGINGDTARVVEKAGATVAVAGSFVFGHDDPAKAIQAVRGSQRALAV